MQARRHQVVARPFRAARCQDRRLKLGEALIDHASPDAGDYGGAKDQVAVLPFPPQVKEAISQAEILGELGFARNLDRQDLSLGLHVQRAYP